jgi:RHS repeat-associated protein
VIENDILSYYSMAEGRVRNEGGGFGLVMKMEYFITDQQGNVRASFEDNNGTVALRQENSYYAFGMQMAGGYTPGSNANKKLYNAGSEWQDDIEGLADYYSTFFREYDPVIGRFNSVDPVSESFESWTTYHYSYNNPVNFNDPMGNAAAYTTEDMIREMREEYRAWHDPLYGDNSSWSTVERAMAMWGWEDWTGGGGGSYEGSYQQLKDRMNEYGNEIWRVEIEKLPEQIGSDRVQELITTLFGIQDGLLQKGNGLNKPIFQWYYVYNNSGKLIGKIELIVDEYSEIGWDDEKLINLKGVQMHVGYEDYSSGYTKFNWIQNIETDNPAEGYLKGRNFKLIWWTGKFVYGDYEKSYEPYYNRENNEKSGYWNSTKTKAHTVEFVDGPNRPIGTSIQWRAILSLVGGNGDCPSNPIFNIHWGFSMDRIGNVTIITPTPVSNQYHFK